MSAELDEALIWIRANAQRELREGRRHIHKNANRHRRELGLPIEPNVDDLREAAQLINSTFKKVAAGFLPVAKQFVAMANAINSSDISAT